MESMYAPSWERRRLNGLTFAIEGRGIDIGAGTEPAPWWKVAGLDVEVTPWDKADGDAHDLAGVPDRHFDFVFSSHLLEHLEEPDRALDRWVSVVRPGGFLLIAVPHRDLYERKLALPSKWNPDHKRFYLPYIGDGQATEGLVQWLSPAQSRVGFELVTVQTGDWGWSPVPLTQHPIREYQIDVLLRRTRP